VEVKMNIKLIIPFESWGSNISSAETFKIQQLNFPLFAGLPVAFLILVRGTDRISVGVYTSGLIWPTVKDIIEAL
jgi:hypothetical protein